MKIVVLDGYAVNPGDLTWDGLEEFGQLTVYDRTAPEYILKNIGDAEIVITNKVVFTAELISKLKNTKYIGVFATGYNSIDVSAAARRGITVTNIPAYSTDSVAQMTFAHILNITNRVDHYARENRDGRWSRCDDFCYVDTPLFELSGKTIGLIGLGNIGSKVASIAVEFGMHVSAFTRKSISELPEYIQKTTMDGLLATSDILSIHCPLTDSTRNLINRDSLSKMNPGAILINTSRGPIVNDHDVAEALRSGRLAAYGADVMSVEPPAIDNPLLAQPNAFITPHIAWATHEARTRLVNIAVANVRAFLAGYPQNVVNQL